MTVQLFVMRDKVSKGKHFFTRLTGTLASNREVFCLTPLYHILSLSPLLEAQNILFVPSKISNRGMKWSEKRMKSLQDPVCIPELGVPPCPGRFGGKWLGTGTLQATEGPKEISHGQSVVKCWKQKELFFLSMMNVSSLLETSKSLLGCKIRCRHKLGFLQGNLWHSLFHMAIS